MPVHLALFQIVLMPYGPKLPRLEEINSSKVKNNRKGNHIIEFDKQNKA